MNHPTGDHHLNHRADRGFTLVEMLLVLVILSTLAAIIYPSMAKHGLRARITGDQNADADSAHVAIAVRNG